MDRGPGERLGLHYAAAKPSWEAKLGAAAGGEGAGGAVPARAAGGGGAGQSPAPITPQGAQLQRRCHPGLLLVTPPRWLPPGGKQGWQPEWKGRTRASEDVAPTLGPTGTSVARPVAGWPTSWRPP